MLCVRGGTQAPRGEPEGVTSVDRPGRSSDEQLRIGSLLVSVEGEPKSFFPPALFLLWSKSTFQIKKVRPGNGEKFFV